MINLLVLKETDYSEKRVALVPDEIKKYLSLAIKSNKTTVLDINIDGTV